MKIGVIGSAPAVWGFALTGVQGWIVETPEAVHKALDEALADGDIGILLMTEDVAQWARSRVDELVMQSEAPLVVELPSPHGTSEERPAIHEMLRRMLGVEV